MKRLKNSENLIIYQVIDMKTDIKEFGGDPKDKDLLENVYHSINRVIEKCDLWSEINACIGEEIEISNEINSRGK